MTVLMFFVIMLEKINTNEKLKIVIVKEYQHKSTVKGFLECTLEFIGQRWFIDILRGNLKD